MKSRDFVLAFAAAAITAVFLDPTLKGLGLTSKLPFPILYLMIAYVALAEFGILVAGAIGRKIAILWQIAKFGLIGILNTAVDFGILNYLSILTGITSGTSLIPLNALSFSVAVLNSYWWNKNWVFEGKKRVSFVSFLVVSAIGILINTGIVVIATNINPFGLDNSLWLNVSKALATVVSLTWNFLGYRLIVFKK